MKVTYIFGIDELNQLDVDPIVHARNGHEISQRHRVLERDLPRGSMHLNVQNNHVLK